MFVVGILILFFSVSQEVNDALGFVDLHDLVYMPGTTCDAVLQIAFAVIKIQVGPTVAFAPLNQFLAICEGGQRTYFLIGIHPFFDNRANRILPDGIGTNVDTVQVTARTGDEEAVVVA